MQKKKSTHKIPYKDGGQPKSPFSVLAAKTLYKVKWRVRAKKEENWQQNYEIPKSEVLRMVFLLIENREGTEFDRSVVRKN